MKIHILTHNTNLRTQLGELFERMDRTCIFHDSVEPIEKAVKKLNKGDCVFYDLQLEDVLWAFERLYICCKRTNLVTFERFTKQTSINNNQCPGGVDNYLLIPENNERAFSRLQDLLKDISQKTAKTTKKKKKTTTTKKTVAKAEQNSQQPVVPTAFPTIARYLIARSSVMQNFLGDVQAAADSEKFIVLSGDDGCEFETVAREINFRANGDASPMHVIDPLNFNHEDLKAAQASAKESDNIEYCYLGLSVDWNTKSAEELSNFIDSMENVEASLLKFIVGYAPDLENFSNEAVKSLMEQLHQNANLLEIPNMEERGADIAPIAHSVFSTLRMAHPFLRSRSLAMSAIKFLESDCGSTTYTRLVRVIRNTMALSQNNVITDKELSNLSDNSPTTQHLIESMADERYFKTNAS